MNLSVHVNGLFSVCGVQNGVVKLAEITVQSRCPPTGVLVKEICKQKPGR